MSILRVVISGPRGKMGQEAVKLTEQNEELELVAVIDYKHKGVNVSDIVNTTQSCPVFATAEECFSQVEADVYIDLSVREAAYPNSLAAMTAGVRPVIGATGFTDEELATLEATANDKKLGCIVAPNFAVGAILMMKFAQMAAKHFQDVEILELHHDQKKDAPSGTAVKTAQLIQTEREGKPQGHLDEVETIAGARGADVDGMRIHSVRLPGLIAHQQVMFGASGQTLTIRHDSYDRASFMSGVHHACKVVMQLEEFVYGLESILD
ncbi:4-hydroxy-tetrahydrodipicolinate reductase [Bacillus fonticola]|uniref:4-hydroxy-tetrahydrodipicolinate reductase n=1 Tax=Bacillus fonticola TaxID=2728853 RepID=UPI001472C159|nr:4-hydroxy-tetrahydrodipicolinate reductase [Bacillus fonticola]